MKTSLVLLLLAAVASFAQVPKLTSDLTVLGPGSFQDVIVQYKTVPSERHRLRVKELGGTEKHRFSFIKAAHYRLSARAMAKASS